MTFVKAYHFCFPSLEIPIAKYIDYMLLVMPSFSIFPVIDYPYKEKAVTPSL